MSDLSPPQPPLSFSIHRSSISPLPFPSPPLPPPPCILTFPGHQGKPCTLPQMTSCSRSFRPSGSWQEDTGVSPAAADGGGEPGNGGTSPPPPPAGSRTAAAEEAAEVDVLSAVSAAYSLARIRRSEMESFWERQRSFIWGGRSHRVTGRPAVVDGR